VTYDRLGRKTDLKDPDLGWLQYSVDPPGRVWKQINPVQRKNAAGWSKPYTSFTYDNLDRMTARLEPDLESHWVYDTAAKGIGQLAEAYTGTPAAKDYDRVHTYGSLGRSSTVTQKLYDGNYTATPAYDAWSRLVTQTVQRKTDAAKAYDLRYNGNGYLAQVQRGSLVLWQAQAQDAAQRITQSYLGNGLVQTRSYNSNTGWLDGANLTNGANATKLSEGYNYDALGNVMQRTQYWDSTGFVENFGYDALNRLTSSQVSGQTAQTFSYFADGGLKSKSGAGTGDYVYPAAGATATRPHAVQSIPGIGSFGYDDDGNLTSGGGRTATWTSFDMPVQIAKGSLNSSFVYGPEHQRTKQVRSDGTTLVYAGAQEVETNSSGTTVKTYWPNGLGVEIDRPGQATELDWVHADRLGSVAAITDGNGNLSEKLAYDAWGKRRTIDGIPVSGTATPDSLNGVTDNKGFTDHEMLDQLELVHMNGRVYDPLVGRFLSGDPIIQDPLNGQNYNRYSYVLNNPTNLIDPTGFEEISSSAGGNNNGTPREPNASPDWRVTITGHAIASWETFSNVGSLAVGRFQSFSSGMATAAKRIAYAGAAGAGVGALRALPAAGTTILIGGGPEDLIADGVAAGEVIASALSGGTRSAVLEAIQIMSEGNSSEAPASDAVSDGKSGIGSASGAPGDPNGNDNKKNEEPKRNKKASSSEVGEKVRTPDSHPEDFQKFEGTKYRNTKTGEIWERSNTNHTDKAGEWKVGSEPGRAPRPTDKITVGSTGKILKF
jgi:RHS repeat-associated protein